ncbi:MlaC/ttg2D family ABC transporter substrate-binding protein [Rickettsia endosymbiont of Halotydeus destructor]|uniref:MlaC/ttg2D family ABC transporter substrate-binding protein n=1 Tax=Rickettsia endosymbiont of Halotydeus destructor TaxID=2996754 RepID=UPI003BB1D098
MKKIITGIFLLCISFAAYSLDNTVPAGLNEYITKLTQDASAILNNPNLTQKAKIAKAQNLMKNNLDFDWMAHYTIGRIGRQTLSPGQIKKFVGVYSEYVTKAYTDLIKDYKGEQPKITGVRSGPNPTDFIVTMKIINNKGQEPITVEYLIHEIKKGIFKVANITTEGISLINAQQEEFTNTLQNEGFDKLVENLQKHSI